MAKFLGITLGKSKREPSDEQWVYEIAKNFENIRPAITPRELVYLEVRNHALPITYEVMYYLATYSDVLRIIHNALRKEIFRHGYEVKEQFACKCAACQKEFQTETAQCDECQNGLMIKPDPSQKIRLEKFLKRVNDNGQNIITISEQVNDDIEIVDSGFLLLIQDYFISSEGRIVSSVPVELIRVSPLSIKFIADKTGRPGFNDNGLRVQFCVNHRDQEVLGEAEKCALCGTELLPAFYATSDYAGGKSRFYAPTEICQKSKYKPNLLGGMSVIYGCWMKVVTLLNMDDYIKNYYSKQRPPRGLLFVKTPNIESLTKMWNWAMDLFKKNPHQIPPIGIEDPNGKMKGDFVKFVDFMRSLDELQFIETRNEMRRQIGANYGVSPIFQNDVAASGGLNNEGLEITVTNRAVFDGQGTYNDGFYPWLLKRLNITDYTLTLVVNERQDLKAAEELRSLKIGNALSLQQMGFDVTLNDDDEFEFGPLNVPVKNQQERQQQLQQYQQPQLPEVPVGGSDQLSGAPLDLERAEGAITSSDAGVFNPVFGRKSRRENLTGLMGKLQSEVLKEVGMMEKKIDITPSAVDVVESSLYAHRFEGVSKTVSERIKDAVLAAAVKGVGRKQLSDAIVRIGKGQVSEGQAEVISQTEYQAAANKIREVTFAHLDLEGEYLYKWVSIPDQRRTAVCEAISERTAGGVGIDELKNIVREESIRGGFDGSREFTPHYACRSTFVKKINSE